MKIAQSAFFCAAFLSMILGPSAFAQVANMAPSAPIPAQILNGKTAFISYAGVELSSLSAYIESHTGSANGLYNEFYADIKDWGKYRLVDAPADADLILEIKLVWQEHPRIVTDPDLRLRIRDPKTGIVLWEFMEPMTAGSGRAATRRTHWVNVLAKLVNDAKQLVNQPAANAAHP